MTTIEGFHLTHHAKARMEEMKLSAEDVGRVIVDYQNRYATHSRYGEGAFCYQLDGVAVATVGEGSDSPAIATILWRKQEQWKRDSAPGVSRG